MAIVEALNSLGVAFAANSSSSSAQQSLGGRLIVAAVSIQIGIILVFFTFVLLFCLRCRRAAVVSPAVLNLLRVLPASMVLIFARCMYRLIEHTQEFHIDVSDLVSMESLSPLLRFEIYFYIFEAGLILINSVLWNIWNPGRLLPSDERIYLALDGMETFQDTNSNHDSFLRQSMNIMTFGLLNLFSQSKNYKRQDMKIEPLRPSSARSLLRDND